MLVWRLVRNISFFLSLSLSLFVRVFLLAASLNHERRQSLWRRWSQECLPSEWGMRKYSAKRRRNKATTTGRRGLQEERINVFAVVSGYLMSVRHSHQLRSMGLSCDNPLHCTVHAFYDYDHYHSTASFSRGPSFTGDVLNVANSTTRPSI